MEQLVTGGHLKNLIDHEKTRARAQRVESQTEEEVQTIHVIHGPLDAEAARIIHAELNEASSSKKAMLVGPEPKRACTDNGSKWTISFTEKDLDQVQLPHNDALMVTLRIKAFNVWHVLIDQGRSAEIMYFSLFKDLKLPKIDLHPSEVPLITFNRGPVWLLRLITLPVRVGSKTHQMEFVMVDVLNPYNAIASTYHQVVRFISAYGHQEDLY